MAKELYKLLENGFGVAANYSEKEHRLFGDVNLNCAERILRGANIVYDLGLSEQAMCAAAPFGGGMGVDSMCGSITGALMVLGIIFTAKAEKNTALKTDITIPFIREVQRRQGGTCCSYNKERYAQTDPFDCLPVVLAVTEVLEETIEKINSGQ
ncbi:MAG: C_GCAxxG_C_C family protein [Fastidiosipila sp.]|nr:C_GCAxxG_C_C family protein [Fastidiosipila sp.]